MVVGASVAGLSHLRSGTTCQDRFAWRVREDGAVVIAVADGLGSAARSHEGADEAVKAAVRGDEPMAGDPMADPMADPMVRVELAREALVLLAKREGVALRDLACTLSVTVWRAGTARVAHIGDGAVLASTSDGLTVLSGPAPSEYVNETDPLTGDDWLERVRISDEVENVAGIAAFTDGVQHAAIGPDGSPSPGFLGPLLAWTGSGEADEAALASLLGGTKLSEHNDDDMTLVLAVFPSSS